MTYKWYSCRFKVMSQLQLFVCGRDLRLLSCGW